MKTILKISGQEIIEMLEERLQNTKYLEDDENLIYERHQVIPMDDAPTTFNLYLEVEPEKNWLEENDS